jgi:hypothetical protein
MATIPPDPIRPVPAWPWPVLTAMNETSGTLGPVPPSLALCH